MTIEHHVHFSGGSGLRKDNNIMIQPQRHGHIDAHLGFLKLHHRLRIRLRVIKRIYPFVPTISRDWKSMFASTYTKKYTRIVRLERWSIRVCLCRYHIEFSVPWSTCIHPEGGKVTPELIVGNYNANCRIIDLVQERDGLRYDSWRTIFRLRCTHIKFIIIVT